METFIPKEALKEVRRAEKEEKPERLQEFKEKFAYQKEGIARVQELLIGMIRDNPDMPLEELETFVNQAAPEYGLSNEQKKVVCSVLKAYTEKHKAVDEIRSKYPNDNDLFEALFGRPPQGKVEIIEGPMTLYIRAHDERDYAYIYSRAFIEKRDLENEDIEVANLTGGVSISEAFIKGLEGTIIAEKAKGKPFRGSARGTYVHEEQHAINRLFKETFRGAIFGYKLARAKTNSEREPILARYLRGKRQYYDSWVKDEIIAFLKCGNYTGKETYAVLTRPEENGGLYDYSKDKDDEIVKETFNYIMKAKEAKGIQETMKDLSWLSLIERIVKEVYGTEYHRLIAEGIAVFERLRKEGYSMEQTIALLINEPLSKWAKVARRILEDRVDMG